MNIALMKVTVAFIGLVNFKTSGSGREVIVPQTPGGVVWNHMPLVPHRADVSITGLTRGESGCKAIEHAAWDGSGTCTLNDAKGTIIALASTTAAVTFDTSDHFTEIPSLSNLCMPVGDIEDGYLNDKTKYAVRMTITKGQLHACLNGSQWSSYLIVAAPSVTITQSTSVPDETFTARVALNSDAMITIDNHPIATGPPTAHFGWYYYMSKNNTSCGTLPTARTDTIPCLKLMRFGTSGDVGCSNSNAP